MDRRFVYIGAIPQDLDSLKAQKNALVALGWMAQGTLGTSVAIDGLACTPTVPTSLVVNIGPGAMYSQETTDDSSYGSIPSDILHQIIKQGLSLDTVQLTLTPPGTPGQAINYLVQAQFLEEDIDASVLPYFNPNSLTNPDAVAWSGPSNSGVSQPLTRRGGITITLKAGVAATAGSQVTPDPDAGYTGLYAITVAQGQTQITAGDIVRTDQAPSPFVDVKLPNVPYWVQSGSYSWAEDSSAVADAIDVALDPIPYQMVKGFGIRAKIANANTGPATLTIKRGTLSDLGPYPVVRATGAVLQAGDIAANQIADLIFDGTSFRDITGTTTNTAVGGLTASSGEGIYVDGSAVVNLAYYNLASNPTPDSADLFSFYDVSETHHRVLTLAQLISLIGTNLGSFQGMDVIYETSVWSKPSGVNKVLAIALGGGGAGGGGNPTLELPQSCGTGGGGGETCIAWCDLTGVSSVASTIGDGGTGVSGLSGNSGLETSFGNYAKAKGGLGGAGPEVNGPLKPPGAGGTGGAPTAALLSAQFKGAPGGTVYAPNGGDSFLAGGSKAWQINSNSQHAGDSVGGRGAGGSGIQYSVVDPVGSSMAGGAGGKGLILLLMFS